MNQNSGMRTYCDTVIYGKMTLFFRQKFQFILLRQPMLFESSDLGEMEELAPFWLLQGSICNK